MKRILIASVALCSIFASGFWVNGAWAAPSGSAELVIQISGQSSGPSRGPTPFPSHYKIDDECGKLIGATGEVFYLERQNGGYKGLAFGRDFDLTCSSTECSDNGGTEISLSITPVSGGYEMDGRLDYISVHAVNTTEGMSVSLMGNDINSSMKLIRQADGSYSGTGMSSVSDFFSATLKDNGSLAGLTDPATFVVVLVSPLLGS